MAEDTSYDLKTSTHSWLEFASGGTRSAIASCSKAGTDELHFDALTPSAIAQTTLLGSKAAPTRRVRVLKN